MAKPKSTGGPAAQALRLFEEKFAKSFGEGRLSRRGRDREVVSTGSLLLDQATGVGGLVVGRCYESWGPPSVGKSTMNALMVAEQQKRFPEKMVGWLDVERTFDEAWVTAHGVDVDRLWIARPQNAEDVADQVKMFMASGLCSYVTVDSIGALISQVEIEKDAEDAVVGSVAKIVTRMVKMAAPVADDMGCTFHVINQVRANIGAYGQDTVGSGGFALQHGTSGQFTFKGTGETPLTVGDTKNRRIVGKTINVVVSKNKLAPPMRSAMITLKNQATVEYGPIGIDLAAEAFQLAERLSLVERAGAWYTLTDGSRHQGGDAAKAHLRSRPGMIAEIRELALAKVAHTVIDDELKEGA